MPKKENAQALKPAPFPRYRCSTPCEYTVGHGTHILVAEGGIVTVSLVVVLISKAFQSPKDPKGPKRDTGWRWRQLLGLKKFAKPRRPNMDDGVQIRLLAADWGTELGHAESQEKLPYVTASSNGNLAVASHVWFRETKCSKDGPCFQEAWQKEQGATWKQRLTAALLDAWSAKGPYRKGITAMQRT